MSRLVLVAVSALILNWGCSEGRTTNGDSQDSHQTPEVVISLLGEQLEPVAIPEEIRRSHEANLARAREQLDNHPGSLDAIIWVGRRLAYLGRYREAIEIFSAGLDRYPDEPRLYRHRGHRFITTRDLGTAIEDLETAALLVAGKQDRIEPDGLPNASGTPTSTLQSNIWYHLGLAHYLRGDFRLARRAHEKCLQVSKNPDMLVATSHWLYMTLRRLELDEAAAEILEPISREMDILENQEYHQLLLLYQDEILLDSLASTGNDPASAALEYGIGNWHLYNDRSAEAEQVFSKILRGDQWAAFGYLAAEAERARRLDE